MIDPYVFPDATQLVAGFLNEKLDSPVGTVVPQPRPDRFVLVRRVGGTRLTVASNQATLTLEAWGEDEAAAQDLCQLARAWFHTLPGEVLEGTPVYSTAELAGPARLPDPVSQHERFTCTVAVHLRGAALTT